MVENAKGETTITAAGSGHPLDANGDSDINAPDAAVFLEKKDAYNAALLLRYIVGLS